MSSPVQTALEIRSFHVDIPEEALGDLRRRIATTQWPEKETVGDQSQGVQLETMQKLAEYWASEYEWRRCEDKLNALPQFITEIDGLDIHFIHVRSERCDAAHRQPWMAGLDHRAAEDRRSAHESRGTWREPIGRLPCRDSVDARLRVLREADEYRLGS